MIWKATYEEQKLRYELAIFKLWLSRTSALSSLCTFQDLALPNVNNTVARVVFDEHMSLGSMQPLCVDATLPVLTLIRNLAEQTISAAETVANQYMHYILNEKEKLMSHLERINDPTRLLAVIDSIGDRQINMVQRAQFNLEQQFKALHVNQS